VDTCTTGNRLEKAPFGCGVGKNESP
jgi:hypothetical protein